MKWNLIADSSCDLLSACLSDTVKRTVIPMKLLLGEQEWDDDANLDTDAFVTAMKHCHGAVKSACPAPGAFLDAYREAEQSICICITKKLSGTYNSALQAKRLAEEEFPQKKIFVLDSKATAGKMRLLLEYAQDLVQTDLSFEEVCSRLESYRDSLELLFSLSSFGNLIKNGRMPRLKGALATVMGIRPVAEARDGAIEILEKPRGNRKALLCLAEEMKKKKPQGAPRAVITHCQNQEDACTLAELIRAMWQDCEIDIAPMRGLCSLYADEKGLIVSF